MPRRSAITLALLLAAGCAGREGVQDAGESTHTLVRLELSYTRTLSGPGAEPRFDAQGRFVRYRAFDRTRVPTILGYTDYDALPLELCRVTDGAAELDEALGSEAVASSAEVALLDAGRLELRGPLDHALLRPHHSPDLVPFVSGVVYGGDETSPVTLALGQPYQVAGEGGSEVGAFAAQVSAPRAFAGLTVDPLRRGGELELRWAGDPLAAEPLLIEVKWASRAGGRAVRCRARDDGQFTVPREALEALHSAPPLTNATVTIARVSRSLFSAPGVGRGELTFALREIGALVVAP